MTFADFEAHVRLAGFDLTRQEIEHLHEGWLRVEPMLTRIRSDLPAFPLVHADAHDR
jgi:hypothetical protein